MANIDKNGRIKLTKVEEEQLFSDCNGLCSICGKSLTYIKNGKYRRGYQAAHIYPHSPTDAQKNALQDVPMPLEVEGIDNIILLCERSHHIQDDQTTQEDYLRLYDIKQKQHRQRKAKESISEINIEPEIDKVLEGLRNVKLDELVELKMIPVEVKQKVSDHILQTKILGYVTQYFNYVQTKLQDIDKTHTLLSEAIAKEISLCFTKTKCAGLIFDQNAVFDAIVNWLISKTQGDRGACEIVVAYYVQDCEVFDATSK